MWIKDIKDIKRDILTEFRLLAGEAGFALPRHRLMRRCLNRRDVSSRRRFDKAVRELVSQGLITCNQAPVVRLELTEKGMDLIL